MSALWPRFQGVASRPTSSQPDLRLDLGVEVRRSARRRRTVSAYREGGRTIVLIPARFSPSQEREWVDKMLARLAAVDRRGKPSDDDLAQRAAGLSRRYLGGAAKPTNIRWVSNQQTRWGSCTPSEGTIRISTRLHGLPSYVVDYVVLHELAHLLSAGHGPDFWASLAGYARLDRARGYLDGYAAGRAHPAAAPEAGEIDPMDQSPDPAGDVDDG
jgi:predicted metal-dependent hydrolase